MIATQNPGKVAELRALLAGVGVEVLGLADCGRTFDEPAEHGRTFEHNAALKAIAYAAMTDLPCLADDSGLEVDALGGRPGVDSSWYAYPNEADARAYPRDVRDRANIELLLRELQGVPMDARTARFVCCMALAVPGSHPVSDGTADTAHDLEAGLHGLAFAQREPADGQREGAQPTHDPTDLQPAIGPEPATGRARVVATSRGTFEGCIGIPPRVPAGCNGFGYDPVFLVAPDLAHTSAELSPDEKNALSHRARAASAMLKNIARLLAS